MKRVRTWFALILAAGLGLLVLAAADSEQVAREELAKVRNLAKAFYENPNTRKEAVAEFKKALDRNPDSARERLNYGLALLRAGRTEEGMKELQKVQQQDPKIPHTWFNLGIEYKKLGEFDQAIVQLEQMARLVPEVAVTQYNLGVLYKRAGRIPESIKKFQIAAQLDPSLAAPHFQLFNSYRTTGKKELAQRELAMFKKIKARQKGAVIAEDMNWSFYSEVLDVVEPQPAGNASADAAFHVMRLSGEVDPKTAGMLVMDTNADGKPDLVAWSSKGVRIYAGSEKPVAKTGLESLDGVTSMAADDFDNDGLMDLAVTTTSGAALYRNTGGLFSAQETAMPDRGFDKAVWMDFDHDNDLDLFLLGRKSALMRNEGPAGFAEKTELFPFVTGRAMDGAAFRLEPDTKMFDLVVSYADGTGTLYRDRLAGQYDGRPLVGLPAAARKLTPIDTDNDSWVDVAYVAGSKTGLLHNVRGKLEPVPVRASGAPVFADLESRGFDDLIAGGQLYRNLGKKGFAPGKSTDGVVSAVAGAVADFSGDGREDVILAGEDGTLHLLENKTASGNRWLQVKLEGKKAPKLAPGAEIEIRSGLHYQKKVYRGFPVVFGVGAAEKIDTVRTTWSNGLIQNSTEQATNSSVTYVEEERLSGSCPMIWTWDGKEFRFITDVLGVAPLGVQIGNGEFFPADHDEYVQLPAGALAEDNRAYEIRLTQELAEVVYMDEVKLLAVDHPAAIGVLTNEKFTVPFPEFKMWGVPNRTYPIRARDDAGRDVRDRLLERDNRYVDGFRRLERRGVARRHALVMDFGAGAAPANDAVLVLTGWTDWAEGSNYLGYSQEDRAGIVAPSLQVKNQRGEWQAVIDAMGFPAGFPKTVVIDLAGKFLSADRSVRIVTNMCLYWDEAYLTTGAANPEVRITELRSADAEVRFRGFSRIAVDSDGKRPQRFFYENPEPEAMWNQTPGMYTRYGKVTELLKRTDDRFVVYGPGDEVRLRFDARALPPLPRGWKRTFVLGVEGWEKDQDPNTITSDRVGPLPFHGMSRYPYGAGEHHPDPEYAASYNTRRARRLFRSLANGPGAGTPGRKSE